MTLAVHGGEPVRAPGGGGGQDGAGALRTVLAQVEGVRQRDAGARHGGDGWARLVGRLRLHRLLQPRRSAR